MDTKNKMIIVTVVAVLLTLALSLVACTQEPIPERYQDPVADDRSFLAGMATDYQLACGCAC